MAVNLESLVVELQLDAAKFDKAIQSSTKKAGVLGDQLKKKYKDIDIGIDVKPSEVTKAEQLVIKAIRNIEREQKKLKLDFTPTSRNQLTTGIRREQASNVQTIRNDRKSVGDKEKSLEFLRNTLKATRANKSLLSDLEKSVLTQKKEQVAKLAQIEKNTKPKKQQNQLLNLVFAKALEPAVEGLSKGFTSQFAPILQAFGGFEGIGSTLSSALIKATNDLVIPNILEPLQTFLARGDSINDILASVGVDIERSLKNFVQDFMGEEHIEVTEKLFTLFNNVLETNTKKLKDTFEKIDQELSSDSFIGEDFQRIKNSRAVQTVAGFGTSAEPIDQLREIANDLRDTLVKQERTSSESGIQRLSADQIQEQITTTKQLINELKAQQTVFRDAQKQRGKQLQNTRSQLTDTTDVRNKLLKDLPELGKILDLDKVKDELEAKLKDFEIDMELGIKNLSRPRDKKEFEQLQDQIVEVTSQIEEIETEKVAMAREQLKVLDSEIEKYSEQIKKLASKVVPEGDLKKVQDQLKSLDALAGGLQAPINFTKADKVSDEVKKANAKLKATYQEYFQLGDLLTQLKGTQFENVGEAEEAIGKLQEIFKDLGQADIVEKLEQYKLIPDLFSTDIAAAFGEDIKGLLEVLKEGVSADLAQKTPEEIAKLRLALNKQVREIEKTQERSGRVDTVLGSRIDTLNRTIEKLNREFNSKTGQTDSEVFAKIAESIAPDETSFNFPNIIETVGDQQAEFDLTANTLTVDAETAKALGNLEAFEKLPKEIKDAVVLGVMQALGKVEDVNPLTQEDFGEVDTTAADRAIDVVEKLIKQRREGRQEGDIGGLGDVIENVSEHFSDLTDVIDNVSDSFSDLDDVVTLPNSMSELLENIEGVDLNQDTQEVATAIKAELASIRAQFKEAVPNIRGMINEDPEQAQKMAEELKKTAEETKKRLAEIQATLPEEVLQQINRNIAATKGAITRQENKTPRLEDRIARAIVAKQKEAKSSAKVEDKNVQVEVQKAAQQAIDSTVNVEVDDDLAQLARDLESLEQDVMISVDTDQFDSSFDDVDWDAMGEEVGENITAGLGEGMDPELVKEIMAGMANDLIETAEDVLDIQSPSGKFREIGEFIIEGLNEGLENTPVTDVALADLLTDTIAEVESVMRDLDGLGDDEIDFSTVFSSFSTEQLNLIKANIENMLDNVDWNINVDAFTRGLDDAIAGNTLDALDDVNDRLEQLRNLASQIGQDGFNLSNNDRTNLRQGIEDFGIVDALGTDDVERQREILRDIFQASSDAQVDRLIFAENAVEQVEALRDMMSDLGQTISQNVPGVDELRERFEQMFNLSEGQTIGDVVSEQMEQAVGDTQQLLDVFGVDLNGAVAAVTNRFADLATVVADLSIGAVVKFLGIVNLLKLVGAGIGKVVDIFGQFTDLLYDVGQNVDTFLETRGLTAQLENVGVSLDKARGLANRLSISLEQVAGSAGLFDTLQQSLGQQRGFEVSESIIEGLANTGLDSQRLSLSMTAISQIASKGVVSMEELRGQLGESFPQALGIAAQAMGLTRQQFIALVSSGQLAATDFLPAFAEQLKLSVNEIERLEASTVVFENTMNELRADLGEFALRLQKTFLGVTGIEKLINNTELLKTVIIGAGVGFTTLATIGVASALKMVLSIEAVNIVLKRSIVLTAQLIQSYALVAGAAVLVGAGIVSVGNALNKAQQKARQFEKVAKAMNSLNRSFSGTSAIAKDSMSTFDKMYDSALKFIDKWLILSTDATDLEELDFATQMQQLDAIATEVQKAFDATVNIDVTEVESQIRELRDKKALIDLQINTAAAGTPLNVIQGLQRQSAEASAEIAALNKQLSLVPEMLNKLQAMTETDEFQNASEEFQRGILQQIASIRALAQTQEDASKRANAGMRIIVDTNEIDIAERKLEDLQQGLELDQLQAAIDGNLNIDFKASQLELLKSSISELEASVSTSLDRFFDGLKGNVAALEELLGSSIENATLDDISRARSTLLSGGDQDAIEQYEEALDGLQEILEIQDGLIDKDIERLNLELEILQLRQQSARGNTLRESARFEGQAEFTRVNNEITAALSKTGVAIIDDVIDIGLSIRNSALSYEVAVRRANALQKNVVDNYTEELKTNLLKAAGITGQTFEQWAASLTSAEVDNLGDVLANEVDQNPILGMLLDDLGQLSDASLQAKEAQLEVIETHNDYSEKLRDAQDALNDFLKGLRDSTREIERENALTQLDNQALATSNALAKLVPEDADSIFGRFTDVLNTASDNSVTDAQATLEHTFAVQDNILELKELTIEYNTLANEVLNLQSAIMSISESYALQVTAIHSATEAIENFGSNLGSVQSSGQSIHPTGGEGVITSKFGMRTHPVTGQRKMHAGVDIGLPGGSDVMAVIDSKVTAIGRLANQMIVTTEGIDKAGNTIKHRFVHLGQNLDVTVGDVVRAGQKIGEVARTTGSGFTVSTGDHLHFEEYINNQLVDPMKRLTSSQNEFIPVVNTAVQTTKAYANAVTATKNEQTKAIASADIAANALARQEQDKIRAEQRRLQAEQRQLELTNKIRQALEAGSQAIEDFIESRFDIQNTANQELFARDLALLPGTEFRRDNEGDRVLGDELDKANALLEDILRELGLETGTDLGNVDLNAKLTEIVDTFRQANPQATTDQITTFAEETATQLKDALAQGIKVEDTIDKLKIAQAEIQRAFIEEQRAEFFRSVQQENLDQASALANADFRTTDRTLNEIDTASQLFDLETQRMEAEERLSQLLKDEIITLDEKMAREAQLNEIYAAREGLIRNQHTMETQFLTTIHDGLKTNLQSGLSDFFKGQIGALDMLRNVAIGVFESLADKAASLVTDSIMGGLFGGGVLGGGGGGGFLGGIFGFNMGGEVGAYPGGGKIPYANKGLGIDDTMMLGAQVAHAMKMEGAGAIPIVAHAGEWILSDKTGDAQLYEQLRASGEWSMMKKIGNFEMGGKVTTAPTSAPVTKMATTGRGGIQVKNVFNVKDFNSFNRSREQLARIQKHELDKAQRRA